MEYLNEDPTYISSIDESYLAQHALQEKQGPIKKSSFHQGKEPITIDSFHLLSIIGKGSYAKVALVRKKDNGQTYALKILKKSYIQKRDQKHRIIEERKVLEETSCQFVVKMKYAFQSEQKLFFVLEYCPGGELFNILNNQPNHCLNSSQSQFYIAQIVLALEYLHSKDIIYRDLKPENVLIDIDGYIKLTDFGLSKKFKNQQKVTQSLCGTPEYLAPEILFKVGHGKMVDFWTLGAILYEMYTGIPPFYILPGQNREILFQKIKYEPVKFPPKVQGPLRDLLQKLLQKEPSNRLGFQNGASDIKNHPFFKNMDWEKLQNKQIEPPFKPILNHDTELKYFDQQFLDIPFQSPPQQDKAISISESQKNDQHYSLFTYMKSDSSVQSPKDILKSQENLSQDQSQSFKQQQQLKQDQNNIGSCEINMIIEDNNELNFDKENINYNSLQNSSINCNNQTNKNIQNYNQDKSKGQNEEDAIEIV